MARSASASFVAAALFATAGGFTSALPSEGATPPPVPPVKIFLSDPGVYRVTYERLREAGWPEEGLPSAGLELRHGSTAVPISVEDGGDGVLGPGDGVVFAGDRLPGEHGYYNEYSNLNVYWLYASGTPAEGGVSPLRVAAGMSRPISSVGEGPSVWQRRIRREEDRLLLRYPGAGLEDQELWYWQKLSYLDTDRFEVDLDLSDLDVSPGGEIVLAIEVRGWSQPRVKPSLDFPDHAVEVLWDGEVVGRREWSGTAKPETIEVRIPTMGVAPAVHRVGLRVPERPATDNLPLVDVSILNWIEALLPRTASIGVTSQMRIEPRSDATARPAAVLQPPGTASLLWTDQGERFVFMATSSRPLRASIPGAQPTWVVPAGSYLAPRALELDRPSNWKSPDHQADYLIVAHPRLAAALAPLVALRRSQGLTVAEIDVRDLYDEWSGGATDPRAIRDFVDYAFHHWRAPAPRFLLLVGDASWDGKNDHPVGASPDWAFRLSDRAEFIQNGSTPYDSQEIAASRNLIPTWGYGSAEGHAAGDNAFVAVDGDDELPDLAVGRFPVVNADEVAAIVQKIVAYESQPVPGDWHSRVLWITNEETYTQTASDRLSSELEPRGYSARKVYPVPVVPPTSDDQVALRGAFDEGALLVHFFGHGGRYIWRTAAPDLASQRDLFDLSDVEALAPSGKLPMVLSMTCYSAPFDHPTADSIGEKLLREPGKGAVAVFAASWRNSPREEWSRALFTELLVPGSTIGEAILRVKRRNLGSDLIRQYNLIGDPALRLALPAGARDATVADGAHRAP